MRLVAINKARAGIWPHGVYVAKMSDMPAVQKKKPSYATVAGRRRVVASPRIVEREAEVQQAIAAVAVAEAPIQRPERAPWSKDGVIVGTRHFGPLCQPNPRKTMTVKVYKPDTVTVSVVAAPASSCVLL